MAFYSFKGFVPVVHPSSFVHPSATVTGNVIIGKKVYIGPGAALRGDWGQIIIKDGCNVQENCTIHMFPGTTVVLEEAAHIGHGAIIHGAHIGKNCLIGMNAVVMDDATIGENSVVGALCFVPAKMQIPPKSIAVGNPAKIIKEATDEMIAWKTKGTQLYQKLPEEMQNESEPCEPLSEIEKNRPTQDKMYQTWEEIKKNN
ncbi:MAG: transferase hexapeptide repeat family protein [Bacteroidetes bacterium]|nr:transferase hexapeptide repeat family protein [Bacteroidota bacterium]